MKVKIPFKEQFREAMINGGKTYTSRTKQYRKGGDTFDAFGHTFQIRECHRMSLRTVAFAYYKEEGCELPSDFIEIWEKIHPRKGFVPTQWVYVHVFERMKVSR